MFTPLVRPVLRFFLAFGLFLAVCFAQTSTGSLAGRVTDPSGASISGARITLTSTGAGTVMQAVTNAEGYYEFPSLRVGSYSLEAESAGFKMLRQTGITIAVANRSTLNFALELGDTRQTIDVTSQPPLVDSQTSDIGTNFQPKFMADAPLFVSGGFRNPENFISYVGGVNGGQQETSINGGARRSKEILIDGASHTNPESGGVAFVSNGGIGSVEMYSEFKVLTNNFSAEYGRSGGGVEIFVSKSGTNAIHGALFDFLRNDKLDAAGWTVNQRRPFIGKAKVRQNEYGVAVGGPVFIPKLYNGKNRTFWFFTWNGYQQNNGGSTVIASVPTPLMKQGDFSELGSRAIYDPGTTRTVNGVQTRTAFPGNIIPQSRWSSVSSKMLSLIPDPTAPGLSGNYATTSDATVDKNIYSIKLDHSFSDKSHLSGLYSWQRQTNLTESGLPGPLASGLVTQETPDITRVNHDYIFSPTVFNHATFGLSRYQDLFHQLPQHLEDWPAKLGLTGVATNGSTSFPIVTFTDSLTGFGNAPKNRGAQQNWTYEVIDGITWIKGRHEFKFGGEYHRGRTFQHPFDDSYAQGLFNFNSLQTSDPTNKSATGYSFASFLLGDPNDGRRDFNTSGVNNIYGYRAGYAQDNFKVSSRLTLNIGVRYEVFIPRTDTNLTLSTFDPTLPNDLAGGHLGALSFAGTGPGRNGLKRYGEIYWSNFGPRLGLAYQATSKTVVRGGYGMYYSPANGNTGGGCFPCGWGVSASLTQTTPDGVSPAFNWDGGFPVPANFKMPPVISPTYANGQTVLALNRKDGLAGRIQNWQASVQQELPLGILLDTAYVGSYGTHLETYIPFNQVDPAYLSLGALLSQPIGSPAVVAAGYSAPYAGFTGTLAQALRPYPQYNNIVSTYMGGGAASYNALQVKVEKRYSALTLLANYTWEKNLSINGAYTNAGNGVAPQDQYNLGVEKALSIQDVPQTLNLVYTWDLPFGRGRKFLNNSNGLVKTIVGGWTIAGIHQYRSGLPILINAPVNTLGPGVLFTPQLRVITTGSEIQTGVDRTSLDPNNPSVRWLNRAAFAVPGAYQFGTASPYLNDVRNPPLLTESLSLVKRTTIKERLNLEFRTDISNLFNRTSFGGINVNLNDANFGRATGVQQGPRIIQMALRLNF
ncbi:MAG TPA: carboxypeptidase regulatory-like domain-containing protein [Bryobacteraceae bacterium]|nr:carboxypeptidase regulatory-like domain-containing protein [Bryobacteraceae bacterium]